MDDKNSTQTRKAERLRRIMNRHFQSIDSEIHDIYPFEPYRDIKAQIMDTLSRDDDLLINNNFNSTKKIKNLVTKKNESVSKESFMRLKGKWLNDELINFFFMLLQQRDHKLVKAEIFTKPSYFFSSFFYTKYTDNHCDYASVKSWRKKYQVRMSFLNFERLFIPINVKEYHWSLVVVKPEEKEISYLGSLHLK